jgi:hypothetical protein
MMTTIDRITCRDCRGTGQSRNGPDLRCEYCDGTGQVETYSARQRRLTQPAPETGGEWSVDDKYIMRDGQQVGSFITSDLASNAVASHHAVPLLNDLVERLLHERLQFKDKADRLEQQCRAVPLLVAALKALDGYYQASGKVWDDARAALAAVGREEER